MPWFAFKGIDAQGKQMNGEEFASSESDVAARLFGQGISILELKQKASSEFFIDLSKILGRVSRQEMKFFYVNLATLIGAGCALRSSLTSLADQTDNLYFQKVLTGITSSIEAGKSFSESLKEHPSVFPPLFVHLVKAGEEGGMLEEILLRFATLTEKQEKIRAKVRGALVLPAMMLLVALGVVIGLLVYVFPEFMKLFKGKEALMPTPTKMVMVISDFLVAEFRMVIGTQGVLPVLLRIGGGLAALFGVAYFFNSPFGFRLFSNVQLRLPLFGNLFRKLYISSFTRTLGALLKGGVPALQALKISKETVANVVVQDAIDSIRENVEKGGSFTDPMLKNRFLFPKMVVLMVQVGETTGKTDEMMTKVSEYYDAEVDEAISALITAIEPIMTVIMGGIVLFIALSMFLPLFNIRKFLK